MRQIDSMWQRDGEDYAHHLPEALLARDANFRQIWKRRLQLFLIAVIGWIAQYIGWGVSLAIHAMLACLLGFFIVPVSLGSNSVSLETRIGTDEVPVEFTDTVQADLASVGGAPVDLSPVIQEIGNDSPLDTKQLEFDPAIQSTSLLETVNSTTAGQGKGTGSGIGNGIGGGKIEFFGTKGTGNSVVYVVDISSSMITANRYQTAVEEILSSLDRLTKLQRFFVVFFNEKEIPLHGNYSARKLLVATPATKNRARKWIQNELGPGGGTNPIPALERALRMRPDIIYLMTDGDIPPQTRDFLAQDNKKRIVIHTIAFQNIAGQKILKEIAADHGGTFRFVP